MNPSLYPPFKTERKEGTATTQRPTHLKDSPPAPEAPRQRYPLEQVSVVGCSSRETVNPSAKRLVWGAGIRTVGDRRRVFASNTKMFTTSSTSTKAPFPSYVQPRPTMYRGGWTQRCPRKRLRRRITGGRGCMSNVSKQTPLYSESREVLLFSFLSNIRYMPCLVGHVGHKGSTCCYHRVERFSPEPTRPTPSVHGWTGLDTEVNAA
jgi:hypothetical protein